MKNRIAALCIAGLTAITTTACSGVKAGTSSNDKVLERIKYVGEHYSDDYVKNCKANAGKDITIGGGPIGCYCGFDPDDIQIPSPPRIVKAEDVVNRVYNPIVRGIENDKSISTDTVSEFNIMGTNNTIMGYPDIKSRIFDNFELSNKMYCEDSISATHIINSFDYDYNTPDNGEKFLIDTEFTDCPWSNDEHTKLLRIGIKAEEVDATKGNNVVFVIIANVENNKPLEYLQDGFKSLIGQISDLDKLSIIVAKAGESKLVCDGINISDEDKLRSIKSMYKQQGMDIERYETITNEQLKDIKSYIADKYYDDHIDITSCLVKANELATKHYINGGNNKIVFIPLDQMEYYDVDVTDAIKKYITNKDVQLSLIDVGGSNFNKNVMTGNQYIINSERELEQAIKTEFTTTAETVAMAEPVQVQFNSSKVKEYRLLGYDGIKPAEWYFKNICSGQEMTALYEVIMQDSETDIQPENELSEDELASISIAYTNADGDNPGVTKHIVNESSYTESPNYDTIWAAGIVEYCNELMNSTAMKLGNYEPIFNKLKNDPRIMADDSRAEFCYILGVQGGVIERPIE